MQVHDSQLLGENLEAKVTLDRVGPVQAVSAVSPGDKVCWCAGIQVCRYAGVQVQLPTLLLHSGS